MKMNLHKVRELQNNHNISYLGLYCSLYYENYIKWYNDYIRMYIM